MKILVDMNLSPQWVPLLTAAGWETIHWSAVGAAGASDRDIFEWAKANRFVVFTHDLDFGAIIAATRADSPSVIQIRSQEITPFLAGDVVVSALRQFADQLEGGALISVDENKSRARILPL